MRAFTVIVNPNAGSGRALERVGPVLGVLEAAGARATLVHTTGPDHARTAAADAAATGDRVVAVGGDGLVRPIAAGVSDTGGELALVPAGRGNDFARVLAIPSDPGEAAQIAVSGTVREVDLATAAGEVFVGIASLGFDSQANAIANRARLVRGNLVYVYGALRALVTWRPARFTVTVDGARHDLAGYSVAIANSPAYGGGMRLAPMARLDDGLLEVISIGPLPRHRFLRALPRVFRGTHIHDPAVTCLRGREIEVEADREFDVYADGDAIATLPLSVGVKPGALKVVTP